MADEPNKPEKKGFTVGEIEGKFKKYGMEISLSVIFVLTMIFALVWGGAWTAWSIILCMIGGVVGALLPEPIHKCLHASASFATKERVTGIVVAVVGVLLAIFIAPIIFAIVGLAAGKTLVLMGRQKS